VATYPAKTLSLDPREGYRYDIVHPETKKPCKQPLMGYRFPKATMDDLLVNGRILFGEDESKIVELKVYASEYQEKLSSLLELDGRLGAYDLRTDFPEAARAFTNPKPARLLQIIFSYLLRSADDIVMDFFAGSGSTACAAMVLNKASLSCRYVLIQLPLQLDPINNDQKTAAVFCDQIGKPRTIAELTKERLRRAAARIREENPEAPFDAGFRVYKLAPSNLKAWSPGTDLAADLLDAADNLLPGRTDDDLLVELLLKRGIDLVDPMQTHTVADCTVHALGGGALVVCLADVANADAEPLADGIAEWVLTLDPPGGATVIFKDAGFASDVAKVNLAAILRQRLNGRAPDPIRGKLPDMLLDLRSV